MDTTFCPRCGTKRSGAFRFCRSCGLDFETDLPASSAEPAPEQPKPVPPAPAKVAPHVVSLGPSTTRRGVDPRLLLGIGSAGIVVLAVAATMMNGNGSPSGATATDVPDATNRSTRTPTTSYPVVTGPPRTARPTPTQAAREDLALIGHGFAYFGGDTPYVEYGVLFENPNPSSWIGSVSLNISFIGNGGTILGNTSERISAALPGQRAAAGGTGFPTSGPVTAIEVAYNTTWDEIDFTPGVFSITNVRTVRDDFSGLTTTGTIEGNFEEQQEFVKVVAIYRDAAGDIVGGGYTFVDFVPTTGRVGFEINTLGTIPGVDTTEVYADL